MSASLLTKLSDNNPIDDKDESHWEQQLADEFLYEIRMLLSSRARLLGLIKNEDVNRTIINYGINENVSRGINNESIRIELEGEIRKTIEYFEPRLDKLILTSYQDKENNIVFFLSGDYKNKSITFYLVWDESTKRFKFDE